MRLTVAPDMQMFVWVYCADGTIVGPLEAVEFALMPSTTGAGWAMRLTFETWTNRTGRVLDLRDAMIHLGHARVPKRVGVPYCGPGDSMNFSFTINADAWRDGATWRGFDRLPADHETRALTPQRPPLWRRLLG